MIRGMSAGALLLALIALVLGAGVGYLLGRGAGARTVQPPAAPLNTAELEQRLSAQFGSVAAEVLSRSNADFLQLAEQRLKASEVAGSAELEAKRKGVEELVTPLQERLLKLDAQIQELEKQRAEAFGGMREQMDSLTRGSADLRRETSALVQALRAPQTRGRWGEVQLQRVVELAGMQQHCDFLTQDSTAQEDGSKQRPDLTVTLTGGRTIFVDSKVPLSSYLDAHDASEPAVIEAKLQAHAKSVKAHVDALAKKEYWNQPGLQSPELVVLFIPGEAFLAPALERDTTLLDAAMEKKVIIATPTTLVAMLRTIEFSWRQERLSQNAQKILDLGKEMFDRIQKVSTDFAGVGKALGKATDAYNAAVGSLETRLFVTARKLHELGSSPNDVEAPAAQDKGLRPLTSIPGDVSQPTDIAGDGYGDTTDLQPGQGQRSAG